MCIRTIAGGSQQKVILYYIKLPELFSITLIVAWQLLLVFCYAKKIQLLYCNSSFKGALGVLHKQLC